MSEPGSPEYEAEQINKRRNTRSPLIVEKIPIDDGYKTLFGYAKNISRGGLFIATVKPREPGETFTVEFSLPLEPPYKIRCQCKVVWKRLFQKKDQYEPGMGLCFVDIDNADAEKIDEWVDGQSGQLSD